MKLNYLSMIYLRMHAKWLLAFSALFLLLFTTQSCTKEPNEVYTVEIANESTSPITVKGFQERKLSQRESIGIAKNGFRCNYSKVTFTGYRDIICKIDSISIVFNNGKGYYSLNQEDSQDEKSIKPSLFLGEVQNFRKVGKNHYQYVITEEHYKNAHVLP